MQTLEVKSFSCIDRASISISDLTVIVGPQAAGKSLLCKLNFFLSRIFSALPHWYGEGVSGPSIEKRILEDFSEWFQPTTWGSKAFSVGYSTGPFEIIIARTRSKSKTAKATLSGSQEFFELLSFLNESHKKISEKKTPSGGLAADVPWRVHSYMADAIQKRMKADLPQEQLFIPAGRSFFTSIGKIVTAFDDRTLLDPVVTQFGRLVTALRSDSTFERSSANALLAPIESLLGGKVKHERGRQKFIAEDGRDIPFAALSSGQQELLPLLYGLRFSLWRDRQNLLYIEEPEAHLFPSAQTALVDVFSRMINSGARKKEASASRKVVLTTHSPYVLAKVNNLLKAGQLSEHFSQKMRLQLEKIVPAAAWLKPSRVAAYAIEGGRTVSILDDFGLINGDYIDAVSSETGAEFDGLIRLEIQQ